MSENPVILVLALKSVPPAAACGCGADGKSFLLWPSNTTSAAFVAKKSVLTKSFLCKPAVSAGTLPGGGGGAIGGAAPTGAAIFPLAGSSRFIFALASFAARLLAGADANPAPDGCAGTADFASGAAVCSATGVAWACCVGLFDRLADCGVDFCGRRRTRTAITAMATTEADRPKAGRSRRRQGETGAGASTVCVAASGRSDWLSTTTSRQGPHTERCAITACR